jgi:hypothetical protein
LAYELRYFFDPGSGICLWASSEQAREKFGYPVDHWSLPLSENTRRWLNYLIAWFDTSIDWSAPGNSNDRWTTEELERFRSASRNGLALIREELHRQDFVVLDS